MYLHVVLAIFFLHGFSCTPAFVGDDPYSISYEDPDDIEHLRPYGPFFEYLNPFTWFDDEEEDKNSTKPEIHVSKDKALYRIVKCLVLQEGDKCKELLEAAETIFEKEDDVVDANHDQVSTSKPATNQTENKTTTAKPETGETTLSSTNQSNSSSNSSKVGTEIQEVTSTSTVVQNGTNEKVEVNSTMTSLNVTSVAVTNSSATS